MTSPSASRPLVVLVGPPGAAVPQVAQRVADLLAVGLVDTDVEVERLAGRPVGDVLIDEGEDAFRALERRAAGQALGSSGVVALGGGTVEDASVREALAGYRSDGGTVVFLDVTLAHAVPRLGFNQPRPLLPANPRALWQTLMDQRRPQYEEVASIRLDTDGFGPAELAAQVVEALRGSEG